MVKSGAHYKQESLIDEESKQPYQMWYRWVMLSLVWLLYCSCTLVSRSIAPLITPILEDLNISYSQMGFILGAWSLIYIAIAAIGGVLLGLTFPFVPSSGISYLIIAFGVVIMGGLDSMLGTFIGGIVFGLAQTLGGYFLGATAQLLIAYLIVLLVLGIRPQGLFTR